MGNILSNLARYFILIYRSTPRSPIVYKEALTDAVAMKMSTSSSIHKVSLNSKITMYNGWVMLPTKKSAKLIWNNIWHAVLEICLVRMIINMTKKLQMIFPTIIVPLKNCSIRIALENKIFPEYGVKQIVKLDFVLIFW